MFAAVCDNLNVTKVAGNMPVQQVSELTPERLQQEQQQVERIVSQMIGRDLGAETISDHLAPIVKRLTEAVRDFRKAEIFSDPFTAPAVPRGMKASLTEGGGTSIARDGGSLTPANASDVGVAPQQTVNISAQSIASVNDKANLLTTANEQSPSMSLEVDENGETEISTRDFLNQDESIEAFSEDKADAEKKAQEAPFAWPKQMHHFASNKNKKYTPQFEKIISKYGLKLDDRWNKETMNHLGRHPNEYHEWILESLKFSDSIANGDVDLFKAEFEKVKQRIRDNPILLRKKGWK